MFPIPPNGNQTQQNLDSQRHCILVAASNPYLLPTPVYRLQVQNLDKSENMEEQIESRSSDAKTVTKSFVHVPFSTPILIY
jgi:mediator of RNA polymerase II transcription subunit 25